MFKVFFLFFVLYISSFSIVFASQNYENQGFKSYIQNGDNIKFQCEKQCFIVLGKKEFSNFINISGKIGGKGIIGYGFFNGKQVIPGEVYDIKNTQDLKKDFFFNTLSFYSQLPKEIPVMIIMQGNLLSDNLIIKTGKTSFFEDLRSGIKEFFKYELQTPYSINLRYGVKLFGIPIVKFSYILIFIIVIGVLFLDLNNKKNIILYVALSFFIAIGFRNLLTYYNITYNGLSSYTFSKTGEKTFYDLGDYLEFTSNIRKKLNLDSKEMAGKCDIYIDSYQDWPFIGHWKSSFLEPCDFVDNIKNANYAIYYKKEIPKDENFGTLIKFNDNYLLKINKK